MYPISSLLLDFFFSYSVPSVIYTLSLHDALPIFVFMVVLQMAFLTPPFGFAIFYLKSAVGEKVGINRIYKATIPFITIQLIDRKSTRLNSSHVANSYAVFCLNKKTQSNSLATYE